MNRRNQRKYLTLKLIPKSCATVYEFIEGTGGIRPLHYCTFRHDERHILYAIRFLENLCSTRQTRSTAVKLATDDERSSKLRLDARKNYLFGLPSVSGAYSLQPVDDVQSKVADNQNK